MKNRVINDVLSHSGKKVHPRIILTPDDFKRIREGDDCVYNAAKAEVMRVADYFMDQPLLNYEIPDGIRLLAISRRMLARSFNLGMAYQLTGDKKYARRLYEEMKNVSSFKDWNPYHFLDVGEMSCAVGLAYDWIYDEMTEEEKKFIREALISHGFEPAMDDYLNRERKRSYRWYQDTPGDNWKMVCNGGITVAALAVCDEDDMDAEYLSDIFGYAYENTYRAVRDFYLPDGSYSEGFTYWNYATDYLGYYVSALKTATGTDYGLADYKPVEDSAYYVKFMCSNTFHSFNFGDAIEELVCPETMFFIGKNFAKADVMTMRCEQIERDPSLASAADLFWYEPTEPVGLDGRPMGFGSVGGDNASFRTGFKRGDFYAAIHFGDNDAYHGHLDMGNFVVEWKENRFLCDLGQDNYNVPNYRIAYRYRAEGHNTVVINPDEGMDQVQRSICHVDRFSDGSEGDAYAISDMSAAYSGGKKMVRGMRMTADKKWLIVRDEMELDEGDVGYWFAHTRGNINVSEDGKSATIEMGGEKIYCAILGEGEFTVMPAKHLFDGHVQETQRDNSDVTKLTVRFIGSTNLSVAIAPMTDGKEPDCLPEDKELSAW